MQVLPVFFPSEICSKMYTTLFFLMLSIWEMQRDSSLYRRALLYNKNAFVAYIVAFPTCLLFLFRSDFSPHTLMKFVLVLNLKNKVWFHSTEWWTLGSFPKSSNFFFFFFKCKQGWLWSRTSDQEGAFGGPLQWAACWLARTCGWWWLAFSCTGWAVERLR